MNEGAGRRAVGGRARLRSVRTIARAAVVSLLAVVASCGEHTAGVQVQASQSCMLCHNGSLANDYGGPGLENPHPFPGAEMLLCTDCHGGNGAGADELASHVPPPPQIGDEQYQTVNAKAYFNRLTLA